MLSTKAAGRKRPYAIKNWRWERGAVELAGQTSPPLPLWFVDPK